LATVDYADSGSTQGGFMQIIHPGGGCPAGSLEVVGRDVASISHAEVFFVLIRDADRSGWTKRPESVTLSPADEAMYVRAPPA
jgi:hypothetical protein